jgi:hypothetical protein
MSDGPYSYVDRAETAQWLRDAVSGRIPASALRDWIRAAMVGNAIQLDPDDAHLLGPLIERLDMVQDDDVALLELAADFHTLLAQPALENAVTLLLELVVDRARFLEILRKYDQGVIRRTQFLSYLSEQPWPQSVRARVATLSSNDVQSLRDALSSKDYRRVASFLT